MKFKRSIGIGVSAFLLLCFSVTLLPLDFFHNHTLERTICRDSQNQPCNHKYHLSSVKSYCWACAAHLDSKFAIQPNLNSVYSFPTLNVFSENKIVSYFADFIFSALRGPPQN